MLNLVNEDGVSINTKELYTGLRKKFSKEEVDRLAALLSVEEV